MSILQLAKLTKYRTDSIKYTRCEIFPEIKKSPIDAFHFKLQGETFKRKQFTEDELFAVESRFEGDLLQNARIDFLNYLHQFTFPFGSGKHWVCTKRWFRNNEFAGEFWMPNPFPPNNYLMDGSCKLTVHFPESFHRKVQSFTFIAGQYQFTPNEENTFQAKYNHEAEKEKGGS